MLTRLDRALFLGIGAYTLFLLALPLLLPHEEFKWWVSETGPLENAAIVLWLVCAAVLAIRIRPFTARTLAFATLFLMFAAREADLHKAFTAQGIFKLDYYRRSAAPLGEKSVAAVVALLFVGLAAYVLLVVSARFLLRQGGLKSRSGMWLALAWAVLVLSKMMDRSKQVLGETLGVSIPPEVALMMPSLEEGFEALAPFLFIASAWISQTDRRYLS